MVEAAERPSPEAMLAEAAREARGRLKVFLGAAPGVGKTYAMLEAAQRRKREGVDVVVAVVETHGRVETEALLAGLEVLPRRELEYRGRRLTEMDLDAVLARRPRLALVDELAHANVEGSRHPKRYQDAQELLAAGIDVYATLNIQHLESLNDVIARITRIRVRETLPDKVLELADEVELVDLSPDDLIQRLREGKVYLGEQAQRAIRHFFGRGNLTALRELALRAAADQADAQMLSHMQAHAVAGPWPTRERLMVCIGPAPGGPELARAARRMAERQKAPWIAVHLQSPKLILDPAAADQTARTMRLAEQLGGETVTLTAGEDLVADLLDFARQRNVTRIVIGRTAQPGWKLLLRKSLSQDVIDRARDFEVTIVTPERPEAPRPRRFALPPLPWRDYALASLAAAVSALVTFPLRDALGVPNVSLVFLVAVLVVAVRLGLWPSIYASLVCFLTYNFLYTEPYYTFEVKHEEDLLTILFFLVVAILGGNVAARVRDQVAALRLANRRTNTLFEFSRRTAGAVTLDDVVWAVVHHVASALQCRSLVLLPQGGELEIAGGYPPEDALPQGSRAAAEWAWRNQREAGWGSDTLPASEWLFLPLRTSQGVVGLLGVAFAEREIMSAEQRRLLDAVADQAAVAVERGRLNADLEEARLSSETEKLRSALLASVSHDLRTPLVSILGAASSLVEYGDGLAADDRLALARTVQAEAERLNRFVQNLLDMTRLGHGGIALKRDWVDANDLVARALTRLRGPLASFQVDVESDAGLPLLHVDPVLMEQVLVNVLDNAARYAPAGSRIAVALRREAGAVTLRVLDEGPGIPEAERELVFDMFYRVKAGDRQPAGTGLGLAICRGLTEAHGGTIVAGAGPCGRGLAIELRLPAQAQPAAPNPAEAAE